MPPCSGVQVPGDLVEALGLLVLGAKRKRYVSTSRCGGSTSMTSPSTPTSGTPYCATISAGMSARNAPPGRRSYSVWPG